MIRSFHTLRFAACLICCVFIRAHPFWYSGKWRYFSQTGDNSCYFPTHSTKLGVIPIEYWLFIVYNNSFVERLQAGLLLSKEPRFLSVLLENYSIASNPISRIILTSSSLSRFPSANAFCIPGPNEMEVGPLRRCIAASSLGFHPDRHQRRLLLW